MAKSKAKTLPKFSGLENMVKFFDTHDLGDYLEQMPQASFQVHITQRARVVALDEDLADRLTEIARERRTSSKTLVNRWLREKVSELKRAD